MHTDLIKRCDVKSKFKLEYQRYFFLIESLSHWSFSHEAETNQFYEWLTNLFVLPKPNIGLLRNCKQNYNLNIKGFILQPVIL